MTNIISRSGSVIASAILGLGIDAFIPGPNNPFTRIAGGRAPRRKVGRQRLAPAQRPGFVPITSPFSGMKYTTYMEHDRAVTRRLTVPRS